MTTYDERTALVVVDVQNDFADPAGSLSVPGADDVIAAVNTEIESAAAADATIVYTQDWHPPRTPHFVTDGGPWPVHCVWDTWGAQLHPALTVKGGFVLKGIGGEDGYSGFTVRDASGVESSTGLHELLHEAGIERVVVVGLALDYCV
ncbi:MAG: isochorismatase family protein, partial [Actinomycetes bacterium]